MEKVDLAGRVIQMHETMRDIWPDLSRLAVALYDEGTGTLQTFINSTKDCRALHNYSARLEDVPSLKQLADTRQTRVIQDMEKLPDSNAFHTQWLLDTGFRSSYTVPLYGGDQLVGFLFFDSSRTDYFTDSVVRQLAVYSELICSLITGQLALIHVLSRVLNTIRKMFAYKDGETAAHTQRVGHFSRLIASRLAEKYELSDEYLEYILQFAPLHDIGKIGVPERILFKPSGLSQDEFSCMMLHVDRGLEIINSVVEEFDLGGIGHLDILRNIVGGHHERYNGSGYPSRLQGKKIPLEARITAVADVMDALTMRRSYKEPWGVEEAMAYLQKNAGVLFDPDCVAALDGQLEEICTIRDLFQDEPFSEDTAPR